MPSMYAYAHISPMGGTIMTKTTNMCQVSSTKSADFIVPRKSNEPYAFGVAMWGATAQNKACLLSKSLSA